MGISREASEERDLHRSEDDREAGERILANLKAILDCWGAKSVHELGRYLYKHTDCGPHLSVRLHDGEWRHSGSLVGIENGAVRALRVGSIVEGSDATVEGDEFDLLCDDTEKDVVARFNAQVDEVDRIACDLWDEANSDNKEGE